MEFFYSFIRKIKHQSSHKFAVIRIPPYSLQPFWFIGSSRGRTRRTRTRKKEEEKVGNAYCRVSRDRGINQNESRHVCIACDAKEQNEGESRGRILANLINGDIDGRAFFLRVNTTGDLSRLCRSLDAGPPRPELPLFALFYFSFHCAISSLTLAPRRSSSWRTRSLLFAQSFPSLFSSLFLLPLSLPLPLVCARFSERRRGETRS